jgi:Flp pilus assembly protein TadG
MRRFGSRKGSPSIEFLMAGIPLLFMIISVVELSRGMWIYETLAHAVETTTRDMAVRGYECATYVTNCPQTIGSYAQVFGKWAIGLDPGQLAVTFTSNSGTTVTCNPLSSCNNNVTAWPPNGDNHQNLHVYVTATFPFRSAISMFFFGSAPVAFGTFTFSAKSHQQIQF